MNRCACILLLLAIEASISGAVPDPFAKFLAAPDPTEALQIVQQGPSADAFIIQRLEKGGRVAALCAWALCQHPRPAATQALRSLLSNPDQVAGYWAARALGRLSDPATIQALTELLPAETNGFWELAAGGVGRLRDAWDEKGNRYNVPAKPGMPNLRVGYAAMESLGMLGGQQATTTLLRALTNDQYLIRYGAVRGLGRMAVSMQGRADHEIRKRLSELSARDPVLLVRSGAKQALLAIEGRFPSQPDLLATSPIYLPSDAPDILPAGAGRPPAPEAIAFIKTRNRSAANLGFRDSYFFPLTPKYHSGENLFLLKPARPNGELRNLTQLTKGEVQGGEASYDGKRILFAMRKDRDRDGFHIFEIETEGTGLRQITRGNCNDVDPSYLPDGRIVFCSDRAGYQEYYHQERSRVIYVMNSDGTGVEQITFNPNQDYEPLVLSDGRVLYDSYRFYAQDGSEGPLRGEWMGLARIETVLRVANPDGSGDNLFYGSMRGSFFSPMRPMPFSDQFAGWHRRGYHVGVSVSQARELPNHQVVCITPAGLTLVDPKLAPLDCEIPVYPEVVNLAGGERVYIHPYDEMNPVGRFTSPYPAGGDWIYVAHAPWHDQRPNGYGIYLFNLATREIELVYDDPQMSEVDPIPIAPQPAPVTLTSTLAARGKETGRVVCNSVFNSDLPFDRSAVKYVRVLEGVLMGQSVAANAAFRTRVLGTAPIHPDGSFFVEVPADTPLRFELLDEEGRMLVHETEFNYVRGSETKGCAGCHESRRSAQANQRPMALSDPPVPALRKPGDLIFFGLESRPYNAIYRP